jgi:hypothetical protein
MNLPWLRLVTLLALLVTVPVVIRRMLHLPSLHQVQVTVPATSHRGVTPLALLVTVPVVILRMPLLALQVTVQATVLAMNHRTLHL